MKCPKCGGTTTKFPDGIIICDDLMCDWNSTRHTYQQRLDKVLTKFNNTQSNEKELYKEIIDKEIVFDITYINNQFNLTLGTPSSYSDEKEWVEYNVPISLDTVEHLIKDTEAE